MDIEWHRGEKTAVPHGVVRFEDSVELSVP